MTQQWQPVDVIDVAVEVEVESCRKLCNSFQMKPAFDMGLTSV
jgi:hypothetical protein